MDTREAMRTGEQMAADYWKTLGDVTVADAMAMPWGGERNLALRKALNIRFPGKTVVQVNQGDVIQVVPPSKQRAEVVADQLREGLDGFTVEVTRRADGQWIVTGYRKG